MSFGWDVTEIKPQIPPATTDLSHWRKSRENAIWKKSSVHILDTLPSSGSLLHCVVPGLKVKGASSWSGFYEASSW